MNLTRSTYLALLVLPLLAGCGSALQIPRPGAVPPKPLPAVEPSIVEIPVSVNLASIAVEVERSVPTVQRAASDWTVVTENAVGDVGIKYELRRDPLRLTIAPNTLRATSRVRYWFQVAQRVPRPIIGGSFWQDLGSCGVDEEPREAIVGMETRLVWSEEYSLLATTTPLATQFPNRCEVTLLRFDVTSKVNEGFAAGLKQGAALADAKIRASTQFKPMAQSAWSQLAAPIRLDSALWLVIDPQSAYVGPIGGTGLVATGAVGFTAVPRVVLGAKPAAPARALPKLMLASKPPQGLHITVEGRLDYADAGRLLTDALRGETFSSMGHDVRVTKAAIWGAGDRAVVELTLAGDVEGVVYLVGAPAYDAKGDALFIRDLDYSLETSNVLASTADWLLHGTFRSSIAESTRWPLTGEIATTRKRIATALNGTLAPNVTARATISGVRPVGVYIGADAFVARVAIDGTLSVNVQ